MADVFLSYKREDAAKVRNEQERRKRPLALLAETYPIPKKAAA